MIKVTEWFKKHNQSPEVNQFATHTIPVVTGRVDYIDNM